MDCTTAWDLLTAYLDGDLPETAREGIADHLRRCPRCAEEERALKETLSLLRTLPAEPAPPELLEGVKLRIAKETARTPLWKKLFLPAHIKIPLEAAAVALIFVLVYGIQKEVPPTNPPPASPPSVESKKPEAPAGTGADRSKADLSRERRADAAGREARKIEAQGERREEAPPETVRASVPEPPRENIPSTSKSRLPAVPATRVSTGGGAIESAFPRESPEKESAAPRVFASPPSRMLRSVLYGREVSIEVAPDARVGMENRIAELALRLGGAVRREGTRTVAGAAGETRPLPDLMQVHIPAVSSDAFLEGLGTLGTIPPEGKPEPVDFLPGPSSGSVVYTVRIRVR